MNTTYAGFWLRFVAYIIDAIIISIAQWFVFIPLLAAFGFSFASQMEGANAGSMTEAEAMGMFAAAMGMMGTSMILAMAIGVAYYSVMEASKYQGTVGKIALGLTVTDTDGNKLSIGKAIVRNLCKIISGMIFLIGYIMAGFTDKKQALHDIIAGALVTKKATSVAQI